MEKEIIKAALQHPETIKDVIDSGLVGDQYNEKLERVYGIYLKTKEIPSEQFLKQMFGLDLKDENEADREMVYQLLHELNVERYAEKIYDELQYSSKELSIERIHDLEKKYLKNYGCKADNRFLISSVEDVKKLRDRISQKEELFLETGFPSLNQLTKGPGSNGGWHPGAIYTIVGLSGYGKSIFLANFARDMWEQGNSVLYISTEMSQEETFERLFKSKYKVKNMDEVVLTMEPSSFPSNNIEVVKVHPNDTTCDDIQKLIDDLNWKPDMLFIDYADELKSHEKSNNEYEAQGIVYAGIKKLAEVNNLPVLTATQTNRGAEDNEKGGTKDYVGYNAVADSSKKIRLVDMLFSITQSSNEKGEGVINLFVLKNRFGESQKKISFSINYQTMRIDEIERPASLKTKKVAEVETVLSEDDLTPAEKFLLEAGDE